MATDVVIPGNPNRSPSYDASKARHNLAVYESIETITALCGPLEFGTCRVVPLNEWREAWPLFALFSESGWENKRDADGRPKKPNQ